MLQAGYVFIDFASIFALLHKDSAVEECDATAAKFMHYSRVNH